VRYRSLAYAALAAALLVNGSVVLAQAKKRPPAQQPTGPQPIQRAAFIAQMDAQFGKMDTDKNGQLIPTEIEQAEKERALAEAKSRNESLFDQLDVNRNGQISATEFAKLVTEPATVSAQPMLAREDLNRDGQISQVEHRTATLANFDRIDTDKDGVASVDEMKAGGIAPR
jgi:Ca2+-binding EF-hand superfamily protein